MVESASRLAQKISGNYRALLFAVLGGLMLVCFFYFRGITKNPPGFYLDESGIAYNAYTMARTGAGEDGTSWPLYFRLYTGGFSVYTNPVYIYLLAALYLIFPPSILLAKLLSAIAGLAAALVLGFLAWQISNRRAVAIIVALTAMFTPWLFEVSRLVFEVALYPLTLTLFLFVLYNVGKHERWSVLDCALLAATLALVTYSYTIGRLFAALLALGLLFFATSRERLISVAKAWVAYGVTLIPLLVFNRTHPGALTERFYLISYIKPHSTWSEIAFGFIKHYLDNLSLSSLLLVGDTNPRHHVEALGSFLVATFILALIGVYLIIKNHWREPWWRFILYGLAVSPVSASLTADQFHTLRMIPYPVFLLVLTVPALAWLINGRENGAVSHSTRSEKKRGKTRERPATVLTFLASHKALSVLLALTLLQVVYFQARFHEYGPQRGVVFDAGYRELYNAAVAQPARPIYLLDGMWGPAYIHAFWYATLEGRPTSEFIHLDYGQRPPPGALVISSEDKCATNCQLIMKRDPYLLYRAL